MVMGDGRSTRGTISASEGLSSTMIRWKRLQVSAAGLVNGILLQTPGGLGTTQTVGAPAEHTKIAQFTRHPPEVFRTAVLGPVLGPLIGPMVQPGPHGDGSRDSEVGADRCGTPTRIP